MRQYHHMLKNIFYGVNNRSRRTRGRNPPGKFVNEIKENRIEWERFPQFTAPTKTEEFHLSDFTSNLLGQFRIFLCLSSHLSFLLQRRNNPTQWLSQYPKCFVFIFAKKRFRFSADDKNDSYRPIPPEWKLWFSVQNRIYIQLYFANLGQPFNRIFIHSAFKKFDPSAKRLV